MYHLPLLPGYGPNANIRSSVPASVTKGASYLTALSEAEEEGYQGSYFTQPIHRSSGDMRDGYISSTSPVLTRSTPVAAISTPSMSGSSNFAPDPPAEGPSSRLLSDIEPWTDSEFQPEPATRWGTRQKDIIPTVTPPPLPDPPTSTKPAEDDIVEVVFFEYGVAVFFGLTEGQERDILEDIENAGIMKRRINEDDWEVEECHFTVWSFCLLQVSFLCIYTTQHDPHISYPRIYNDFFSTAPSPIMFLDLSTNWKVSLPVQPWNPARIFSNSQSPMHSPSQPSSHTTKPLLNVFSRPLKHSLSLVN